MAQFKLHAYDADVWIPEFKGLNQADVNLNPDLRFAAEACNVETPNGVLQPQAACVPDVGEFEARVETLASFTRRWYEGSGSNVWYVCCSDGKLYQRQAGTEIGWMPVELPSGVQKYQNSTWSWVTYETEDTVSGNTVDVILMSNALDGMIMVVPPDKPTTYGDLHEQTHAALSAKTHLELSSPQWIIRTVNTQGYKFGAIERFGERIWGTAITDEPDLLVYSAPYNPMGWEQNEEIPEDGAGEISQPTWDGDRFYALRRLGDQLIAFKKNNIWRIMNMSPGEFNMQEQYGGGTSFFNTIVVDKEQIFMESADGLSLYDGMSISPYAREQVEQIWHSVNKAALGQSCAALYKNRYYVALPVGDSAVNNAMLVYNITEGDILYYGDFHVESFLLTDDELFITSSTLPGRILKMKYDSWKEGAASGAATRWVSPWIDFGYKRIVKGGFDLYFVPEVQETAVALKFSIQTEKKLKTKQYTVQPLTAVQIAARKEHRGKRLHFSGTGRRFRLIIETAEGVTAPWRLIGGIQMVVETDPD